MNPETENFEISEDGLTVKIVLNAQFVCTMLLAEAHEHYASAGKSEVEYFKNLYKETARAYEELSNNIKMLSIRQSQKANKEYNDTTN